MRAGNTLCVDDPEIGEVINLDTGTIASASSVIGSDYDRLEKLRMELAEVNASDDPLYACPICMVGVYLSCRRRDEKRFFFKHRTENGNCPAITRGNLSKEEIEARKYNAAKESRAHLKLKTIIAESLAFDPNFSEIAVETVWKGMDRTQWRKPDVQALWKGSIRVAFEIQLSTTFLHVIAERRLFYRREGGLICWIFKSFDKDDARMTQDDIFHNNNSNLFLASDETLKASKECNALMLDCRWTEQVARGGSVIPDWREKVCAFSELTLDQVGQRVFFHDTERLAPIELKDAEDEALRQQFEYWWATSHRISISPEWKSFVAAFRAKGLRFPSYTSHVDGLLNALYTAKTGKVVGWRHEKFISAAHTVANSHKNVVRMFRIALYVYDRRGLLESEDHEGKWAKKVNTYKERLALNDPEYDRDESHDDLIAFLFPDVWRFFTKSSDFSQKEDR